jgi:hypothetical protein
MATLGDRLIAFSLDSTFLFGVFAIADAWVFMRWGIVEGTELKLTFNALLFDHKACFSSTVYVALR